MVRPDVPGSLGVDTIVAHREKQEITKIEYIFDCYPETDIVKASPFYAVSGKLKSAIERNNLTGAIFGQCESTKGDQFDIASPEFKNEKLPDFHWLKAVGVPEKDDFGTQGKTKLVISDAAYSLLKEHNLTRCDIQEI